jgi:hypothetical protein
MRIVFLSCLGALEEERRRGMEIRGNIPKIVADFLGQVVEPFQLRITANGQVSRI